MGTYRFPFDARSLVALVALAWLASFAHEFTHHAAGAWLCGVPGRMSLSLFALDVACGERWPWTTAAGPALSYVLMWIGMALIVRDMRRGADPWWGFALVIANKPFLRLLTAVMGGGDEGVLWDLLTPDAGRWIATATVIALSLPPMIVCWLALKPRNRGRVFAAAFLVPMLPLLPVPFLDRAVYGAWFDGTTVLGAWFGVPWTVWAIEAGVLAALLLARVWMPRTAASSAFAR
ncbi:hypothetical protein LF41_815 [Lysobacter dokdonensis DS-58]|uniref:Uncharacterized protein n=1 Tax=Lysobacter dokdonensis DS-58 TaxID=1300345 RepID=A0A0A2X4W4_9GAMM|nr:hypothetical protein [Lysobacter dokdonensis]KGQ20279.1 hypothetical protein LF41_815 [Lysobacter dokdonensis DS-58]